MPTSICPECDEEVYVDAEMEQGDLVTCDECHSDLVVVGLDPIELDLREEVDREARERDEPPDDRRRPVDQRGGRLGIGANQPVQLMALELGGLLAEGLQIGDAEPAEVVGRAVRETKLIDPAARKTIEVTPRTRWPTAIRSTCARSGLVPGSKLRVIWPPPLAWLTDSM